jgi:hypothetical protein
MVLDEHWHMVHDFVNISLLPVVIVANVAYLVSGGDPWLGTLQYALFFAYMICDTLFITFCPNCVASPRTIIAHHLFVVFGWALMLLDDTFYHWISYGMLVEINTWFHVLRRNYRSVLIFQVLFFISWFAFRNVLYPLVLYYFAFEYVRYSELQSSYFNNGLIILSLIVSLNILNAKWTYDLTKKMKIHNYSIVFDEKTDKGM